MAYLHTQVKAQPHHGEVVHDHRYRQVERFSVSHQYGADLAHHKVTTAQGQHGPWRLHQEPVLGARVCEASRYMQAS